MSARLDENVHTLPMVNLPQQTSWGTISANRWAFGFKSTGAYFISSAGTQYKIASYAVSDNFYPATDGAYYVGSAVFRMAGVFAFSGTFTYDDSATTTVTTALTIGHNSSGTPAAGFGTAHVFQGESDTVADTIMARIRSVWVVTTHGRIWGKAPLSSWMPGGYPIQTGISAQVLS